MAPFASRLVHTCRPVCKCAAPRLNLILLSLNESLPAVCSQLLAGVSYIDTLKHGKDNSPVTTRMKNLQKVFGTGHPLTWWLPLSALPQGAATLQHVIKKGE